MPARLSQGAGQYLEPLRDRLSHDSRRRLETNPLRVLDSKEDQHLLEDAPLISDYLCADCREAFALVRRLLDQAGIEYTVNPRIVRGLDYYARTAFEFWHGSIGSRRTRSAAAAAMTAWPPTSGWPSTPAVGFACGLDRTVAMLAEEGVGIPEQLPAEVLVIGDGVAPEQLAEVGRLCRPTRSTAVDYTERSLGAKMRSANKLGVRWVVLMNADEARRQVAQLKEMAGGEQSEVSWDGLPGALG